jgi:hypothetical protein
LEKYFYSGGTNHEVALNLSKKLSAGLMSFNEKLFLLNISHCLGLNFSNATTKKNEKSTSSKVNVHGTESQFSKER